MSCLDSDFRQRDKDMDVDTKETKYVHNKLNSFASYYFVGSIFAGGTYASNEFYQWRDDQLFFARIRLTIWTKLLLLSETKCFSFFILA